MKVKEALELVEKRVRCANMCYKTVPMCKFDCANCQYRLDDGEQERFAEALEFVWKTAKNRISGSAIIKEEVEPICKHLSPCGMCDVQTKAFGMIMKCSEVTKDARNS